MQNKQDWASCLSRHQLLLGCAGQTSRRHMHEKHASRLLEERSSSGLTDVQPPAVLDDEACKTIVLDWVSCISGCQLGQMFVEQPIAAFKPQYMHSNALPLAIFYMIGETAFKDWD